MKTQKFNLIFIMFLLSLFSCNPSQKKENKNEAREHENKTMETKEELPPNALIIRGLYATSTKTPRVEYAANHLFDNSEKPWVTEPGTGPDEGVMLYLPPSVDVSKISVDFVAGEKNMEQINILEVFVNGIPMAQLTPDRNTFDNKIKNPRSLYFRIQSCTGTKTREITEDIVYDKLMFYNSKKSVGIKEIKLFNSSGEAYSIVPPKKVPATLNSSSTLEPEVAFSAWYLFDSRLDFGWAEGNKKNSGQDEKISIHFNDDVVISKFLIRNGYQRSTSHFNSNARVKTIKISDENNNSVKCNIKDVKEEQIITLSNSLKGKQITITILDIYPGSTYKDLVISELMFSNDAGWFVPFSDYYDNLQSKTLASVKGTILEKVVNTWMREEETVDNYYVRNKTLLFRTDQSFVIWEDERTKTKDAYTDKIVYEGFWEIIENNDGFAKVKISGKKRNIRKGHGAYKGTDDKNYIVIFHDYISIDKNNIIGERFFNAMPNIPAK